MGETNEFYVRGLESFKAGNYPAAVMMLEQATIEDPKNYSAFLYLGAAYASAGKLNSAIGAFLRAEELKPEDPRVHYNLGQAYEAAGVQTKAYQQYEEAIRLKPYYTQACNAFASLKSRMLGMSGQGMKLAA